MLGVVRSCPLYSRFFLSLTHLDHVVRDVAAGIAILLEAGGLVTSANPPEDPDEAEIEDVVLGSRLYLAIRFASTNTLFVRLFMSEII